MVVINQIKQTKLLILMEQLLKLISDNNRLEWNEYFMSIAVLTSLRSPSIKKRVGCVIVKNNRIISTGYNGFPSGVEHKSILKEGKEINTIHAEQNGISQCARMGISSDNSVIYVTHFPCINCSKMIIGSGIKQVYYLNDNHNEDSIELLKSSNIIVDKLHCRFF